jgi:hypothetical protein
VGVLIGSKPKAGADLCDWKSLRPPVLDIKETRVTPSDFVATVFRHLGIDSGSHWLDPKGRPVPIVTEGGHPIPKLS